MSNRGSEVTRIIVENLAPVKNMSTEDKFSMIEKVYPDLLKSSVNSLVNGAYPMELVTPVDGDVVSYTINPAADNFNEAALLEAVEASKLHAPGELFFYSLGG